MRLRIFTLVLLLSGAEVIFAQNGRTISEYDRELISIESRDAKKYRDLISDKKVRYLRLYDRSNCAGRVLDASVSCPWNLPTNATSFSFRKNIYHTFRFADLIYKDSRFLFLGAAISSFVSEIGDVSLEEVDLNTRGVARLAALKPVFTYEEEAKRKAASDDGVLTGKTTGVVMQDQVYALRSVAFRGRMYPNAARNEWVRVNRERRLRPLRSLTYGRVDRRTDIIVVFRVIRKHKNGSISLLWKVLRETKAPNLTKEKKSKASKKSSG